MSVSFNNTQQMMAKSFTLTASPSKHPITTVKPYEKKEITKKPEVPKVNTISRPKSAIGGNFSFAKSMATAMK
jgi:hypothetical protein